MNKLKRFTTLGSSEMGEIKSTIDAKGIATVTLSNPTRMNAMQLKMWRSLKDTMQALTNDERVRVVILRGEGEAAFVSGADISEFETVRATPEAIVIYDEHVESAEVAIGVCHKPVIAAISGVCYGGGLGIALSCDLRYASQDARFCLPAGKLGLGYGLEDVQRMHRILGSANAAELLLTANVYKGPQAVDLGLAHACVEDVFSHAQEVAERVAGFAPLTLRAVKMALQHLGDVVGAPSEAEIAKSVAACFASEDYVEGRQAFAQKRTPNFSGR